MARKPVAPAKPSRSLTEIEAQLAALKQQVQELEAEAQAIRNAERAEVIDKIKMAVAQYELTAEMLGLKSSVKSPKTQKSAKATKSGKAGTAVVKFRDANGNTWGGKGKRPDWLRQALAAGAAIESFRV